MGRVRNIRHVLRVHAARDPSSPAWREDRPIIGLDTETADGKVFCLSVSQASGAETFGDGFGVLDPARVFDVLTRHRHRSAVNVLYNLDFDAGVILGALPDERLYELQLTNETTWSGYRIVYVRGKFLKIRDPNNHVHSYYDAFQFFHRSLDAVAREWIGEGKLEGVDVGRFGLREDGTVNTYVRHNWHRIRDYCEADADRVRRVWEAFSEVAEDHRIPTARPFSTGYLAEQAMHVRFRGESDKKPGLGPSYAQQAAWHAYHGGRFEVVRRGRFTDGLVTVDVNSQYPDQMRRLPDPSTLYWSHRERPTLDEVRAADWGFLDVQVWTDGRAPLQPFAWDDGERLIYPVFNGQRTTVTRETFLWALDEGLVEDFEIGRAALAKECRGTLYPWEWITGLYDRRQEYKAEGKDAAQYVLKLVLNSLYGKTAQVTMKRRLEDNGDDPPEVRRWDMPIDISTLPNHLRRVCYRSAYLERPVAGRYWNPFTAAYITDGGRRKLLEAVYDSDMEDGVVALATDSLTFTREAWDPERFSQELDARKLGAWDVESEVDGGLVVGCGVYEYHADGEPVKTSVRGFARGQGQWKGLTGDGSLLASARAAGDARALDVEVRRFPSVHAAVFRDRIETVGTMQSFPKELPAGMDRKRVWPHGEGVRWSDLLDGVEDSEPRSLDV